MANQPNFNAMPWRIQVAFVLSVLIFVPSVWMMMGLMEISADRARGRVLRQLADLSADYALEINGRIIERPHGIIADLKRIRESNFNHSLRPKAEWYLVEIRDDHQTVRLLFTDDVNQSGKYWVFLADSGSVGTRIGSFIDADLATFLAAHQVRGTRTPRQ
jgi:hypothetical protein